MQARHRNECGREREPRSYPQLPWVQREAAWVALRLRALSHVDPPRSRTFGKFPVRFLKCAACARHGAPEGVLTRAHVQPRGCERDGSGATSRRPDRRHPVPCERASGVSGKSTARGRGGRDRALASVSGSPVLPRGASTHLRFYVPPDGLRHVTLSTARGFAETGPRVSPDPLFMVDKCWLSE